jgi:hypothetical protein
VGLDRRIYGREGLSRDQRESNHMPFGQFMNAKGIRVWVFTWGEILDERTA